jgi:activator of HSP90 ATPase
MGAARDHEVAKMSIHQEAVIEATPEQVYAVLVDGERFGAMTGMPARISDEEGTVFTLFGGRIEGRQVELVPGERVVQAWRAGAAHPEPWGPGVYSIVRYSLAPHGAATRFVIDHDAIPPHEEERLAGAYPTFYQDPLAAYFAE